MRDCSIFRKVFFSIFGSSFVFLPVSFADEVPASWLNVPEGFSVTQFSSDELASNIYTMTTDRLGRVVVAGPGYIKFLIDADNDGKAESVKLFSKYPKNGAQGMCFDGTDLLCVGDGGVLRLQDRNQDDVADGPPQILFPLQTGGEHDSHAIRKGPDGWWYLISGNYSKVQSTIVSSVRSPVKNPVAGVITRISPDFRTREVIMDGMRNAYDFDFNSKGDIFVYDSDGERDVSLPWYQPTRVYRVQPGANAGWVSRSWKRPDYFFDMPVVAARLGRGSPTGVACYRHWQFPKKFHDAIFVLDWTFGRVIAVTQTLNERNESEYKNELFVTGKGTHGFAPTDCCVGIDGSLYISVGGRATQGSVYRIRYDRAAVSKIRAPKRLVDCLDLPQPLSAWSRNLSEEALKKIERDEVESSVFNESIPMRHRVRAVEILTEKFAGLSRAAMDKILVRNDADSDQDISADGWLQSRLAWSVCRQPITKINPALIFYFMKHSDPNVRVAALEAMTGNQNVPSFLAESLLECLKSDHRHLRKAASQFVSSSGFQPSNYLKSEAVGGNRTIGEWFGIQMRKKNFSSAAMSAATSFYKAADSNQDKVDALRLMQIALGDVGGRQGLPEVFESYNSRSGVSVGVSDSVFKQKVFEALESDDARLSREVIRMIAVSRNVDPVFASAALKSINESSTVENDIHVLGMIAYVEANNASQTLDIANAILGLQKKIDENGLNQDRNWEPRVKEVVRRLISQDAGIGRQFATVGFNRPGQIFLFEFIPPDLKGGAIDRFVETLQSDEDFQMTSDVVRLLGQTRSEKNQKLIRDSFSIASVRDAIIDLISKRPLESDRKLFVQALELSRVKTVRLAAQSLGKLPVSKSAEEQFALLNAMNRVAVDREGYQAREWIVRVLQKNLGRSFGFVFGSAGYSPQPNVAKKWNDFIVGEYPKESLTIQSNTKFNLNTFSKSMGAIQWEKGDLKNGKRLFETLSCNKCHGPRNRLGPDLAGVTKRFSRDDLFRSIVDPSYQVSSRYQTTLFETVDGQMHSGIIIYDAADGVLIRDSDNKTVRIEKSEIERRQQKSKSLMPDDLLKGIEPREYADLFKYLKTL